MTKDQASLPSLTDAADPPKLARCIYPFSAMLTGMRLQVFATLKDRPMRAEEIARELGVNSALLERLLNALVATRLLDLEGGLFANTDPAVRYLVPGGTSYLGDTPHVNSLVMWGWSAFDKVAGSIREGVPKLRFDASLLSEEELEWGFRGTYSVAARAGRELVEKYGFSGCRTLLDVGAGSGGLAAAVAEACPHIRVTLADLPRINAITRRLLREAGSPALQVMEADVLHAPLTGTFDVVVARALIQVLPPTQASRALRNITKAISPGGSVVLLGHILDDSRTSPLEEVGYSLGAMSFYDFQTPHTEHDYRRWLSELGLERIERDRLPNGDGIIIARKPQQI